MEEAWVVVVVGGAVVRGGVGEPWWGLQLIEVAFDSSNVVAPPAQRLLSR